MSELRVVLLASVSCLALAVWLTVSNELQQHAAFVTPAIGASDLDRLYKELRGIVERLEEVRLGMARLEQFRAALESKSANRVPGETGGEPKGVRLDGTELRSELEAIHMAIQGLADVHAQADAGYQSHNLTEIRRSFPTTNWDACSIVMRLAMAEPGAAEMTYFDGGKSAALRKLLMLRPKDVLERFGSPSETRMDANYFLWVYESPTTGADGRPDRRLEFTFSKGYVWDVSFTVQ
jgi:hypothetical protein